MNALSIIEVAKNDGMPENLAKLIGAQAIHETGNFTSKTFLQNNNLFGYKYVKGGTWQVGPGRTSTEGDSYAHYSNVDNSVHEIVSWIKRRQKQGKFPQDLSTIGSPEQYAHLLKQCGYYGAEESEYVGGLTRGLVKINSSL